jgi:Translation initiation factor SUI1
LTTVEGIPSKFDLKKILKVIKKQFACNGTIVSDSSAGEVIQLQGDQRNAVKDFLVDKEKGLEIDAKTIKVRHIPIGKLRKSNTEFFTRSTASNRQMSHPTVSLVRGTDIWKDLAASKVSVTALK